MLWAAGRVMWNSFWCGWRFVLFGQRAPLAYKVRFVVLKCQVRGGNKTTAETEQYTYTSAPNTMSLWHIYCTYRRKTTFGSTHPQKSYSRANPHYNSRDYKHKTLPLQWQYIATTEHIYRIMKIHGNAKGVLVSSLLLHIEGVRCGEIKVYNIEHLYKTNIRWFLYIFIYVYFTVSGWNSGKGAL